MRVRRLIIGLVALLAASAGQAHVRVQPGESQAGATQKYTVSVPTEGDVATNWIELEVPAGVSVISVEGPAETKKVGERTVSILWRTEIAPGQSREFVFVAVNPSGTQEISWKAHQHFVDGSSAEWIESPGSRRPASTTALR